MKPVKKSIALALASFLLLSALTGCGGNPPPDNGSSADAPPAPSSEGVTLRFGVQMTGDTSFGRGAHDFAALVDERSNGRIKVEVFTDGVLGDELEMWESLQVGTLDLCVTSPGRISNFVPEYYVYELPYLFAGYEHRDRVADSEVGRKIDGMLREKAGVVVLGQMGGSGRYLITAKTEAPALADISGLKMRVQEAQIVVDTWIALGTLPVTVAYNETYTALQTGVAEAAENELSTFVSMKWYEPCSYLMLTEHSIGMRPIVMSQAAYDKLSAEDQALLMECGKEAAANAVEYERADEQAAFKSLQEFGVTLVELDNKQEWIDATAPIRDNFAKQYEGMDAIIAEILAMA